MSSRGVRRWIHRHRRQRSAEIVAVFVLAAVFIWIALFVREFDSLPLRESASPHRVG